MDAVKMKNRDFLRNFSQVKKGLKSGQYKKILITDAKEGVSFCFVLEEDQKEKQKRLFTEFLHKKPNVRVTPVKIGEKLLNAIKSPR